MSNEVQNLKMSRKDRDFFAKGEQIKNNLAFSHLKLTPNHPALSKLREVIIRKITIRFFLQKINYIQNLERAGGTGQASNKTETGIRHTRPVLKSEEICSIGVCHLDFGIWILNQGFTCRYLNYGKETSQKYQKIYQERESQDSPGGFGFERTRKTNSRVISKI